MKVAALLSGGVDSSVVVHLLCEQGIKPDLFYIKIGMDDAEYMGCSAEEDIEMAQAIAHKYKLSLSVIDLQKEYWENVVSYLIERVKMGLTPNPDVMCNRLIKFGCFEEKVGYQYDYIATGHYATILKRDGKVWLGTAKDPIKDQTDFLAQLTKFQVVKLMLPLGEYDKEEVRLLAESANLPSAKRKDSQGICFLGKINYNEFIKRFLGEKEGDILEYSTGKLLGKHKGFWFHTIGQRKGLGLGAGPWYVVKKDIDRNIIYVDNQLHLDSIQKRSFFMSDFHFITMNPWGNALVGDSFPITFKIRHTPEFTSGKIVKREKGWEVYSNEEIQGVAPGQFGVVYDQNAKICIGSGELTVC